MMRIGLFASILILFSCTNESGARSALEGAGYTDIEFHGWAPNRCSKDDSTCTSFTAQGPTGRQVEGAVGCGTCKGCTIRTF